jgi:murein DD-endopeptidase MepM/ murein hydrolase activator NlpD
MLRAAFAIAGTVVIAQAVSPSTQLDELYASIRDGKITREAARPIVGELLPQIKQDFYARGGRDAPKDAWRFPVEGYAANSIGGANGSGYLPNGYDWFDGHKSKGHPGHDIFIRDRNQDELDDATGKPVNVLSISSGIVVAYSPDWKPDGPLRGGRYLYIYDPSQNGIFYYAHQRSLLVKPGDIVSPGQIIATVGRSGRNAAAPRSPTHLHVMFLAIDGNDYPRPRDIYQDLVIASRTAARGGRSRPRP